MTRRHGAPFVPHARLLVPSLAPLVWLDVSRTEPYSLQLARIPDVGLIMVAKLDHVFGRLFHMGTTGDAPLTITGSSGSVFDSATTVTSEPAMQPHDSSSNDNGSASGRINVGVVGGIKLDLHPHSKLAPEHSDVHLCLVQDGRYRHFK